MTIDLLFKNIHRMWISHLFNDIHDIHKISIIPPIKKNILFTKYLHKTFNEITDKNIFSLFIDKINKDSRKNYLSQKYSKIWIKKYINSKPPVNTTDLELNEIDEKNEEKYIKYINYIDYNNKKRYLFTFKDFKKIIKSNLERSYIYDADPEPTHIKNPYTNKNFSRNELRFFNEILIDMPLIWHMFVESDYNIFLFKYKYYSYLLPLCIPNYVEQLEDEDIIYYLKEIFYKENIDFCERCLNEKINIRKKIVKEEIIEWIKYLKIDEYYYYKDKKLRKLYEKSTCFHTLSPPPPKSFVLELDFSKPLFCVGYYKKEKRKRSKKKITKKIKLDDDNINKKRKYNKDDD